MTHRVRMSAVALLMTAVAVSARADTQTATWLGGTGSWSDGARWSGGVAPNNTGGTTYDVLIDGGNAANSVVAFAPANVSIGALTIDAGDMLAPTSITSPTINVAGPLTVNGTLKGAVVLPPDSTIFGTGTLYALRSPWAIRTSGGSLTIDSSLTVSSDFGGGEPYDYSREAPTIGSATTVTQFINNGRILVTSDNVAHQTTLQIAAGTFVNHGTIELGGTARLFIDAHFKPSDLGNVVASGAGGELWIGNHGVMDLDGGVYTIGPTQLHSVGEIRNGTLRSASGTTQTMFVPYLDTTTFDDVTLDHVNLRLNGAVIVRNGLHGIGEISFDNPEAIEGLGTVKLDVVEPGISIRGSLFALTPLTEVQTQRNEGRIRVEQTSFNPSTGHLRLAGLAIANAGTLEISTDSVLTVNAGFEHQYSDSTLSFVEAGQLAVDGGGLLDLAGDLDLSQSAFDQLVVLPKVDGSAYDDVKIVTYTGSRLGIFDLVTPGITVSYGDGFVAISGTPTPEPGCVIALGGIALLTRRNMRRS